MFSLALILSVVIWAGKQDVLIVSASLIRRDMLEEVAPGYKVMNLFKELGIEHNSKDYPSISNPSGLGVDSFEIDAATGYLVIKKPPDRDALCQATYPCVVTLLVVYDQLSNDPRHAMVAITLNDINDNPPRFPQNNTIIYVTEDSNPGESKLKLLQANDADLPINGIKDYRLDGADAFPFKLQPDSRGEVRLGLIEPLDREKRANYSFRVLAIDKGSPALTGTLSVMVIVRDINDHAPVFEHLHYEASVEENTKIHTPILEFKATDQDDSLNGRIRFQIPPSTTQMEKLSSSFFAVKTLPDGHGQLIVRQQLDVDNNQLTNGRLVFFIEASDSGSPPKTALAKVTIRIRDVNDDRPSIFIYYIKSYQNLQEWGLLGENEDQKTVAHVTVTDKDSGPGGQVACSTNNEGFGLVDFQTQSYNSQSHQISKMYKLIAVKSIDREVTKDLTFKVICVDNVNSMGLHSSDPREEQLTGSATVKIRITDVNDITPYFKPPHFEFTVPENQPKQTLTSNIVHLGQQKYKAGQVTAYDNDVGQNAALTYTLVTNPRNHFEIDPNTGTLYVVRPFDREEDKYVDLIVQAADKGENERLSATANIRVTILDENDSPPQFFQTSLTLDVEENVNNAVVGTVKAQDLDDGSHNGKIIYSLDSLPQSRDSDYFSIDAQTGQIRVKAAGLDRELRPHYEFKVIAKDNPYSGSPNNHNTGSMTVTVTVLDHNDNPPTFLNPVNNQDISIDAKSTTAGSTIFTAEATDPDAGENATVNYMLDLDANGQFEIDKSSGICFVRVALTSSSPTTFNLRIRAYDLGRPRSLNSTISVRVIQSQSDSDSGSGKLGGEHSLYRTGQVSDRTIIIILVTIFVLLLISTIVLVVLIRYRHLFARASNTTSYRNGQKSGTLKSNQDSYRKCQSMYMSTSPQNSTMVRSGDMNDMEYGCKDQDVSESLLPSQWNKQMVGSFLKLADIDEHDPRNADRMVLANRQLSAAEYQTLDGHYGPPRGIRGSLGDILMGGPSSGANTAEGASLCISNTHTMTPGRDTQRRNLYYQIPTSGSPARRIIMAPRGRGISEHHNVYQVYGGACTGSSTTENSSNDGGGCHGDNSGQPGDFAHFPSPSVSAGSATCTSASGTTYVNNGVMTTGRQGSRFYALETGSPALSPKPKTGYTEDSFV